MLDQLVEQHEEAVRKNLSKQKRAQQAHEDQRVKREEETERRRAEWSQKQAEKATERELKFFASEFGENLPLVLKENAAAL